VLPLLQSFQNQSAVVRVDGADINDLDFLVLEERRVAAVGARDLEALGEGLGTVERACCYRENARSVQD